MTAKAILQRPLAQVVNGAASLFEFLPSDHEVNVRLHPYRETLQCFIEIRDAASGNVLFRCDASDASVWADNVRSLSSFLSEWSAWHG